MTTVIIERFSRVAPFGVRFWDVAADAPVTSGLRVHAAGIGQRRLTLFPNRSGVYILQNIPGFRAFEQGDGSDAFWDDAPAPMPITLEVDDLERRFHPFVFDASVPVKGIFGWTATLLSPPDAAPGYVPVYSAPGRTLPGGMAVLSAQLHDPAADAPAAWAVLEAWFDGEMLARGIADTRGVVVLAFPYPEPLDSTPDSPLTFGVPLMQQKWNLDLRAYYTQLNPIPTVPDLRVLLSQPAADLWRRWSASPPQQQPFTTVELAYGRQATAVSFEPVGAEERALAQLYVTPI